ncbi:MAG: shikimate kinase, partial [Candidatus Methanoperedens sp.]|nr:shikimate kinase [Candidatus Methanoperedens sp.]
MKQAGYAYAYGAGTIINAIYTWKGAAFGIDLKTEAEVILTDNKRIIGYMEEGGDTTLIERSVELTLLRFESKTGAKVATKSQIPTASGLKSSSAAANATVLATLDALGEKLEPLE